MKPAEPPAPAREAPTHVAPSRDASGGYRPALDGLRAIAVLAVIGYHLDYTWLKGGFLGVDVFFVLSGYLITSLLLAEHARTGAIDFVAFWYRRAKRLLPALFVMLIAVSLWIGVNASPFELPMRREDLIWTLFYGANWHFIASGQDYFAQYASASPLRHTWSLAIEEQFYLVWPILVGSALWLSRRRPTVVAGLCIVGITVSAAAMALLYDPGDPSRAYYGTDARAHQLLIGALLAVLMSRYAGSRIARAAARGATVVTVVGVAVLFAAFVLLADTNALYYEGLSLALAVTAALLVWGVETAPSGAVARVISLPPVAWIGQISYGLYLWHWPVILAVTSVPPPVSQLPGSLGLDLVRLAATFAIATASFYLVEQPIRRGRVPAIRSSVPRFAVATLAAIVLVGSTAYWQTSAAAPEITAIEKIPGCAPFSICLRHQGGEGAPVVAVIGDSLAESLDPAFVALAQEHDWTYLLRAAGGCRVTHLLAITNGQVGEANQKCYDQTPGLQQELLATWHPQVIIDIDMIEVQDVMGPDGHIAPSAGDENVALLDQALVDVSRQLTSGGASLVLVQIPPRLRNICGKPSNLTSPLCREELDANGDSAKDPFDAVYIPYNRLLRSLPARVPGVATISITSVICPNRVCTPVANGIVLRYDGLHFTAQGAKWLAPSIYRDLVAAGAVSP